MLIKICEQSSRINNLYYIQNELSEISIVTGCKIQLSEYNNFSELSIDFVNDFHLMIKPEIEDRIADIITIAYKYSYFKEKLIIVGLNKYEKELLYTGLIAADLEDDKKYVKRKLAEYSDYNIDGIFNFRLKELKGKWKSVLEVMPKYFGASHLKDFIGFLLENKNNRTYVDGGRVYDAHYKRLIRSNLLGGDELRVIKEILLSNCGEVELKGEIPKQDENYLKEFYRDRVYFI